MVESRSNRATAPLALRGDVDALLVRADRDDGGALERVAVGARARPGLAGYDVSRRNMVSAMRLVTYRSERGLRAGLLRDGLRGRRLGRARRRRIERPRPARLRPPRGGAPRSPTASRCALERGRARCRRSPIRRRSSASGSTTAPTRPRRGSSRLSRRPSSPSSATPWRRRAPPWPLPGGERQGRLRGRGRVRGRAPRSGRGGVRRRSTTSPATCCSTTSRPATSSSRPRSGCRARCSTARHPAARRW